MQNWLLFMEHLDQKNSGVYILRFLFLDYELD